MDRARDQRPAAGILHPWAPGRQAMGAGRARVGPGPWAQRLRRRRRERLGESSHDGTLRHPPRPERDRVTGRDGHSTDATPRTTSAATPTPTRTPTSAEALAPTSTPTPTVAATPAAAGSGGLGALGWTLLILLVVGLIAALLLGRSRRKSGWDAQAEALERDTRTTTGTQLPSVLTAEDAGQRALSWPPLRAALVDLQRRWDLLVERAPDDRRRNWSGQVRRLLQELVAAVDAENQALATGRDWRLLRPRVDQAEQALSAVLAGGSQQELPVGGEPGRPAPGG